MLQADLSAGIEELLEILEVVVQGVLAAEDGGDELEIGGAGVLFELFDIVESSQPVGDGAGRQRLAFEGGYDADHVDDFASLGRPRRNARHFELPFLQPESFVGEPAFFFGQLAVCVGDGNAEDRWLGDDQEGHRMDGGQHAGRENRPLHALLAAVGDEV